MRGCQQSEPLDFDFAFAYQPIVDLRDQSVFAHEALVRGVAGEGALSVLNQVTEDNRYRFDQLCRTRAIEGAASLNMQTHLSINFCPTPSTVQSYAFAAHWRPHANTTFRSTG